MRRILLVLPLLFTVFLTLTLDYRLDEHPLLGKLTPQAVPRLGFLLAPFHGFWQNAESPQPPEELELSLDSLKAPARVMVDHRQVPHIFAQNEHDLYYLQGYLSAKLRLFQMELMYRKSVGRLSELFGPVALPVDQAQRRMGFPQAAEAARNFLQNDPTARTTVEAFCRGANAYIRNLAPSEYPFEYKFLDAKPVEWTPLHVASILKLMAWDLTGYSSDLRLTQTYYTYGPAVVDSLFPLYAPFQDPIVPPGTNMGLPPADSLKLPAIPAQTVADSGWLPRRLFPEPTPGNGSNNWAVGAQRSASGYPMLANDPHLDLNLPSIWLEFQLQAPGINACGVGLPGTPGIIIGFNENIAWGVTNVGADVLDWYSIRFKDATRSQYWHDSAWKPVRRTREVIAVRGGKPVEEEVLHTHHGPVALLPEDTALQRHGYWNEIPAGCAFHWGAAQPSNEYMTFYRLNRAATYDDYVRALEPYGIPAQNFVFASIDRDVALWANGRFPTKWPGQGRLILPGTTSQAEWGPRIPHAHNPHIKNPERGFVSSANQHSAGPEYPYYLNWDYAGWERGARINQKLEGMARATVDSLKALQNDDLNLQAQKVLPALLKLLPEKGLPGNLLEARHLLASWNYRMEARQTAPSLYTQFWDNLYAAVWEDNFPAPRYEKPRPDRTVQLVLQSPKSPWYDDARTPGTTETLADLVKTSLETALRQLTDAHGSLANATWGKVKHTSVLYLLHAAMPGFSRLNLNVNGCPNCVNSTKAANGPSWKMVVALHPDPNRFEAWGIYPGGQSGNPGSPYFSNRVDDWAAGKLQRLLFMLKPERSAQIVTEWKVQPS